MKGLALALLLCAGPVAAQDAFPLGSAQIVNSPDVSSWPATATITRLVFDGSTTRVEFTKHDGVGRWPDYTIPGWDGPLQYTLWLCVQTPQWACAGFVQFWNTRPASGSVSDPDVPSLYHANWYYAGRWAPIYGHGPIKAGESIAFMVTAGNARDERGVTSVAERSNVVVVAASDRADYVFTAQPPQPPATCQDPRATNVGGGLPCVYPPTQPPITIPPVVNPPTAPLDIAAAVRQVLNEELLPLARDTNAKTTEIHAEVRTFAQQFGSVMAFVGKYIAPAIGTWILATQMHQDSSTPAAATGAAK